jgi:hypothetical protein
MGSKKNTWKEENGARFITRALVTMHGSVCGRQTIIRKFMGNLF